MNRLKNTLVAAGICALLAAVVGARLWSLRDVVKVEVIRVGRMDLTSTARATGQILPRSYTNVLAQGFGRVTEIIVQEGQAVHIGDLLMRVDSVQPAADARAQQAAVDSARAGLAAAEDNLHAAQALVDQRKADLDKANFDWEKGQELIEARVISRKNFESLKSTYNNALAALLGVQAQFAQARAQQTQARGVLEHAQAILVHAQDVFNKTVYRAPINGTITYIAARVGENVVPGLLESEGAYLMTISDMSVVTAEVRVDENEVVNIRKGQSADVQIDAAPGQTFTGRVTEVGSQAVLQSSGLATVQSTSSSSSQEAREFKVVVNVDHPPPSLRPGMTVTTLIQTGHKSNVVGVPFQALVLRPAIEAGRTRLPKAEREAPVEIAAGQPNQNNSSLGVQGVFVVRSGRAIFYPVEIGILGATHVEVVKGVQPGDQLVVGSFTALHKLHSGAPVKIVKQG